jgi:hypothetical protein
VDEVVAGEVPLLPVDSTAEPDAAEVDVAAQSIGQGGMVPVDPLDPAAGLEFREPDEYVVVGPAESFQTNRTETDEIRVTVAAALDADALPAAAGATTTRYLLMVVTPPLLTSYPVSLLGRQIVFADDTATVDDQGAARVITGYAGNYVVIDRDDESASNGGVAQMVPPAAGDVLAIYVGREASEDVSTTGPAASDVFVRPPPPDFVASPAQDLRDEGTTNASTGAQPGEPVLTSGTPAPTAVTVEIADQSVVVGLPVDVFV